MGQPSGLGLCCWFREASQQADRCGTARRDKKCNVEFRLCNIFGPYFYLLRCQRPSHRQIQRPACLHGPRTKGMYNVIPKSPTNTHDASLNRISYGRMLMFPKLCNIAESCLSMAFYFLG
jgi:hypothetical protein